MLGQTTDNSRLTRFTTAQIRGKPPPPPYIILYASPWHLHPNGFLFRDTQGGVPKLSRFRLPPLYGTITLCSDLRLGWSLKQTYSSRRELSNGLLNSTYMHRGRVDSRLLTVGNQIATLTPGLFCVITCVVDVQMTHASPFSTSTLRYLSNGIKNVSMQSVLAPAIEFWNFGESRWTPKSPFWKCESHPPTLLEAGLQHFHTLLYVESCRFNECCGIWNFCSVDSILVGSNLKFDGFLLNCFWNLKNPLDIIPS